MYSNSAVRAEVDIMCNVKQAGWMTDGWGWVVVGI